MGVGQAFYMMGEFMGQRRIEFFLPGLLVPILIAGGGQEGSIVQVDIPSQVPILDVFPHEVNLPFGEHRVQFGLFLEQDTAIEFFKKTGVDALAISYGTMHGASKGKDVKLRKEIPIAIKECMNHEGIQGALVSHGSSTVPRYIVDEINALGGSIQNAYGISKEELKAAIPCGIGKINVDTDIRLAVTRNFRELFRDHPELKEDARVGGVWKLLDEKRDAFDPRAFLAPIMDTVMYGTGDEGAVALITDAMRRGVKEAVGTLIVEFGSYGKAPLVEPATLEDMAARYAKEG